mmetsp:Transcript_34570/g.63554  ORF Transcript_34570/g.63554 Transcript_34570/m.63554 type:complete len:229 (+) Transcript_34570:1964-2650(+)
MFLSTYTSSISGSGKPYLSGGSYPVMGRMTSRAFSSSASLNTAAASSSSSAKPNIANRTSFSSILAWTTSSGASTDASEDCGVSLPVALYNFLNAPLREVTVQHAAVASEEEYPLSRKNRTSAVGSDWRCSSSRSHTGRLSIFDDCSSSFSAPSWGPDTAAAAKDIPSNISRPASRPDSVSPCRPDFIFIDFISSNMGSYIPSSSFWAVLLILFFRSIIFLSLSFISW